MAARGSRSGWKPASGCARYAIAGYWRRGAPIARWTPMTHAHGGGSSMSFYRGMTCENVTIKGDKGTPITAYVARPSGPGPFPGVVLVHHLPGWSELYIETARRFAHLGYLALRPHP